ncbi:alpha/beta fold hydrolase [Pseudonocardia sp. CA-107938]|uniref:alpha/beta fold hydrolase n=1 Tax=Pseudonocardia sp. CA-107938 TaxID=3240021 RepID=UPI003D8EE287
MQHPTRSPLADDPRARFVDLGGPVHHQVHPGPAGSPPMVLVHGLGGSHLNWSLVASGLAEHSTAWTVDLPGFGGTEPEGRSTTVDANAGLLVRFVREVVGEPVVLVGNSMGGMVSILATAAAPDLVRGLVLVDPSVPPAGIYGVDPVVTAAFVAGAMPGFGARALAARRRRLGSRGMTVASLRLCGVEPHQVPAELLDRSAALVDARRDPYGMDRAFVTAARSLVLVNARPRRYWAAMAGIRVPVLLMQGTLDRLVPVASARAVARRNPTWQYVELPGVGHVPQLHVPERFVDIVGTWFDEHCA